ncbi:MAG: hypothetical protein GY801_52090 [bacterium]|nr:hypothetical protein [bacterium]
MKKRILFYFIGVFIGVSLFLFLLFGLSKLLYPPPPVSAPLSEILPDSPAWYIHCLALQEQLTTFVQHEQYRQLLKTPYLQQLLQSEEGQAQLASFEKLSEDTLIGLMQFIGKELVFALYRSSPEAKAQPAAVLLSRVSDKAKLAERVFYAFDWLTEFGVEKLPLKLHSRAVYQVKQQDLLFPIYYTLVSDVAVVSSSLELLETVMVRISEQKPEQERQGQGQETDLFNVLVRPAQPESRFVTAFADPAALADELSSNLFFSSFYLTNIKSVEAMREAPPLVSMFDIYPESIRLHTEFQHSLRTRSDSHTPISISAANSCWEDSKQIRQFPLLLNVSPEALNALLQQIQEIFPRMQQNWQNPFQEHRLWDSTIECRSSTKPVGKLFALPDLLCASDSALSPEESVAAIDTLVNTIVEQQVPPMLRSTMLRQERKPYQEIPVSTLQAMFQDVFSYAALTNKTGEAFNILASNSDAVKQGIDKIRAEADARPSYCANVPPEQSNNDAEKIVPAIGLWLHSDRLARFLEDFSQTKSFELLVPRTKNPEFYAQLPKLLLTLRSLPPMFLEIGLQEENPTVKLWSQGYYIDE